MTKDAITAVRASAYRIPTDYPESDGTLEWDSTTLVWVELDAAGFTGVGYTYGDAVIGKYISEKLAPLLLDRLPMDIPQIFETISVAIRNDGHGGLGYMALSAIDAAVWDLKGKMLRLPVCRLIGQVRDAAAVYGSGGFTSYADARLAAQLHKWAGQGFSNVKMKIGRHPEQDLDRVRVARQAIGEKTGLFVDANGAYTVREALGMAVKFDACGVSWFEEPVSSDNKDGLHFIRDRLPAGMRVAAGEYGYTMDYFLHLLQTGSVDVLQADATRCGGISNFLKVGALCEAFHVPLSFHCAPSLHAQAAICLPAFTIGEYFHDHARIEEMLFEGAPVPEAGLLHPDQSRPGLGIALKKADAERYKIS